MKNVIHFYLEAIGPGVGLAGHAHDRHQLRQHFFGECVDATGRHQFLDPLPEDTDFSTKNIEIS